MDQRGLGINVAGLLPLTPLRHYVLGEASFERPATPEEIATMRSLLREAIHAGAFGLSTTTSQNHTGSGAGPWPAAMPARRNWRCVPGIT